MPHTLLSGGSARPYGLPRLGLLLALGAGMGCSASRDGARSDRSSGGTDTSTDEPVGTQIMHGLTRDVPADVPLAGTRVEAEAPPAGPATGDDAGRWSLELPATDLARVRVSAPGFADSVLWVSPAEGEDPDRPYSHGIGTEAAGEALLGLLGVPEVDLRETGLLYVDALDPEWHDYPGVQVGIDAPFHSVWREVAPFQFDNEPLTTEDRMDLLFVGVPPGPVRITATQPDGTPCTGWDAVEVEIGSVAYVSRYCPDIAPGVP